NCAPAKVDYARHWLTSTVKSTAVLGFFRPSQSHAEPKPPGAIIPASKPIIGTIKAHERVLSREGSVCPALDRHAFQLHRDPRFRLPLPERTVRNDRPRGRWPALAARLQHGKRQS